MSSVRSTRYGIIAVIIVLCTACATSTHVRALAAVLYENVAFAIDPSAIRAFDYGERHFRATDTAFYDIDRAERYFMLAAEKDPTLPYAYHQLARIEFLKSNFPKALFYIDKQIALQGDKEANAYYVRGLILGYMGRYSEAATAYEHYLQFDSFNWAAQNDYAWVLLKAGRAADAAHVTTFALQLYPENPWLLNSNATALFELGDTASALVQARAAEKAALTITRDQWLVAYPGNDPKIAGEGIVAFQNATVNNVHTIEAASSSRAIQ